MRLMRWRPSTRICALASVAFCTIALVAGCTVNTGPSILWTQVTYIPNDGSGSAVLKGKITNIGGADVHYAGIVGHAYGPDGDELATLTSVSIRAIEPVGFVIRPGQTQAYALAFDASAIANVTTFRIVIASSLNPIRETRWQELYFVGAE